MNQGKKQDLTENKTLRLSELAGWIKERYPQEFLLYAEFEGSENRTCQADMDCGHKGEFSRRDQDDRCRGN